MEGNDKYYSHYEKLMRGSPEKQLEKLPEYRELAARYPHIAESIRFRRAIEKLEEQARSERKRSMRLQVNEQIRRLKAEAKAQDVLKRLRGESGQEADFRRRYIIGKLNQSLSSTLSAIRKRWLKVCLDLRERLQEQTRTSRHRRSEKLPPSLFDLRSLDSTDRGLALTEWVRKRGVRTRSKHRFSSTR